MTNWTRGFLARARVTDGPEGDLIAAMKHKVESLPQMFRSLTHMREVLRTEPTCAASIIAVPKVWRRYSRWLQHNPFGIPSIFAEGPQPFGPTGNKPVISLLGRALHVNGRPQPSTIAGFETAIQFEIETIDQVFIFSIDAGSADFLACAISLYSKTFKVLAK